MKLHRLYEITVTQGDAYVYHALTTNSELALEEYNKLRELNTEDRVGLFSQLVDCSNMDNQIQRIV
jgi:hypothetical protein